MPTFRSALPIIFLHGFGLRWNIADRVQVYTDPLFLAFVTVATWFSGNVYPASLAVSAVLTFAAYFLIIKDCEEKSILTATGILILS